MYVQIRARDAYAVLGSSEIHLKKKKQNCAQPTSSEDASAVGHEKTEHMLTRDRGDDVTCRPHRR